MRSFTVSVLVSMPPSPSKSSGSKDREFRVFLHTIAREITKEQLNSLKFLSEGDGLAKGEINSVTTPLEFLDLLWEAKKICPDDVGYLHSLLQNAGYEKLADLVKEIGEFLEL